MCLQKDPFNFGKENGTKPRKKFYTRQIDSKVYSTKLVENRERSRRASIEKINFFKRPLKMPTFVSRQRSQIRTPPQLPQLPSWRVQGDQDDENRNTSTRKTIVIKLHSEQSTESDESLPTGFIWIAI